MPDEPNLAPWRLLVRQRLPPLPVDEPRQAEIEDELAQWLHDAAETAGVAPSDGQAFEAWLAGEVPAWEELARSLVRSDRPVLGRIVGRSRLQRARARMLVGVLGDLRFALRALRRSPGFAIVAVLTLALGIGLNSAVYSLLNSLLFKPLPIEREDRLVRVFTHEPNGFLDHLMLSYPDYEDLAGLSSLQGIGGFAMTFLAIETEDRSEFAFGEMVTGSFFPTLGARAARGRLLTPEDDRLGEPAYVAVVSYDSWRKRFGRDPQIVGRKVRINGQPLTIVGVAPPGFKGILRAVEMEIWLPLSTAEALSAAPAQNSGFRRAGESRRTARSSRWIWTVARLAEDATLAGAEEQIAALGAALEEKHPESNESRSLRTLAMRDVTAIPDLDVGLYAAAAVLMGVVALVLLIACANLANLLLARTLSRQREIATRLSLGAGVTRLIRQLLLESLVLAIAGATLGLAVAFISNRILNGVEVPMLVPITVTTTLDGRVLLFTLLLAFGTALFFGLAPALQAARTDLATLLREDSARGGSGKRRRLQSVLVAAQVALSVVLLAFGGLSLRSALNAQDVDVGFEPLGAAAMTLSPDLLGYSEEDIEQFYPRLKSALGALPAVTSVTASSQIPLTLFINTRGVLPAEQQGVDRDDWPEVDIASVDEDYFETLRTPLLAGRSFEAVDCREQRRVVIVNETLAERLWPGEDPLGKQLRTDFSEAAPRTVVGVAKDGKYRTLGESPRPFVYLPIADAYDLRTIAVRFATPEQTAPRALADTLRSVDDRMAISNLGSVSEVIGTAFFLPRAGAMVFGVLGGLGLCLAAMGLYGVLAYAVGQRTHEIGVRIAMGAKRGDIVRLVVLQGLGLAGIGVAIGIVGAFASTRALSAILYGVSPTDFGTFFLVITALLATSAVAAYLPARRAIRLDPMRALRYE